MIPVDAATALDLLSGEFGSKRALGLNHAIRHGRGGFWADRATRPDCVVLLQQRTDQSYRVLAGGSASPAVDWLAAMPGRFHLLAPPGWVSHLARRIPELEPSWIPVRYRPDTAPLPLSTLTAERLGPAHEGLFQTALPAWAWQSWESPAACIEQGAAFALFHGQGLAACAWILEEDAALASIGVHTADRFRRLGLGRAVGAALVAHLLRQRRKCPVWATTEDNAPSLELARALGFTVACDEPLLTWDRPA